MYVCFPKVWKQVTENNKTQLNNYNNISLDRAFQQQQQQQPAIRRITQPHIRGARVAGPEPNLLLTTSTS